MRSLLFTSTRLTLTLPSFTLSASPISLSVAPTYLEEPVRELRRDEVVRHLDGLRGEAPQELVQLPRRVEQLRVVELLVEFEGLRAAALLAKQSAGP